ncbi:MAG: efflux RND transporter periplasmic adaptor subunit [Gemmatimonadetes bacterium]|nr:efflux RND transporter periplasmic adaptor subunit [Gemmatimonadota bacterium]
MKKSRTLYLGAGAGIVVLAGGLIFALGGRDRAPTAAQAMPGADMAGMAMGKGSVRLTPNEMRTFGITFATAEVRPLRRAIRTVGLVEFDETRMAYVSPKFGGWVERLHVDFTGKPVRKGQPLLDVYSPELVSAQEELLLAARMAASVGQSAIEGVASGAGDLLESAKRRLRYWDISDGQITHILSSGQVQKTLTLHAPVSGIVMEKDVFEGQAFLPGHRLYMIADLAEVWINAEVFESDAALLREGMPAEIAIGALPGRSYRGRVEYVYPTLEEKTRAMRVRIALPNRSRELKPGMYATVKFTADLGKVLALPASAVLHSGERAVAFVDMGAGELMPHELVLGQRGEEYVEVLEGIEPGQRVVTSAQFLLDSESNLAEVMKAMMAQMPAGEPPARKQER